MSGSDIAIRARGLRKVYRRYAGPLDALRQSLSSRAKHEEKVALSGVDIDLKRGEIIGIFGRNGAGKSTLLKIVAGTLEKTAGELDVNGRITAILELGTGFHPEYTGRENILMGGMCLGMSRREINAKIDSIIEFSELSDVIDHPFKTYSTGMQARLAFSTAISVDPDILIVDEALSVGDARFQAKCFARMQQFRAQQVTILLVSHDSNTITTLCDRALILEQGQVYAEGPPKEMSVKYQNLLFGRQTAAASPATHSEADNGERAAVAPKESLREKKIRYGTNEAVLTTWGLFDASGAQTTLIESGARFSFRLALVAQQDIADLSLGFAVKDRRATVVWGMTNLTAEGRATRLVKGEVLTVEVPSTMWLAAGDYLVTLGAAHLEDGRKIDFIEHAIEFRVLGPGTIFTTSTVNLDSTWAQSHCSGR